MTDEALKNLRRIQTESSANVKELGDILQYDGSMDSLNVTEKAQKIEITERELRLKEESQRLEAEKFEYQKKQDRRGIWLRIFEGVVNLLGTGAKIAEVVVDNKKVNVEATALHDGYVIDQIQGNLTTGTGRTVQKMLMNPKL